jgi:hypothetical protein
MPFVELSQVENLINENIKKKLQAAPAVFAQIENEAAIIIRDTLNIEIPEDAADADDFVVVPAAYIINKLCSNMINSQSEESMRDINKNYELALEMLRKKAKTGTNTENAISLSKNGNFANWKKW